jgi:methylmalonyl-CoA/ethylmalonyl-CoA epimerase
MILRIDHVGLVARSLEEAEELFLETLGFTWDLHRTPMPEGIYMPQENARIYFIQVGDGETQIELLLPQDRVTGMGKWLDKRGPSVHHIAYMVDDVEAHAAELIGKGLERIDLGSDAPAAFFYPRTTMGILTELVDARTVARLHADAMAPSVPPPEAASGTTTTTTTDAGEMHDHGTGPHRHVGGRHPHRHTRAPRHPSP